MEVSTNKSKGEYEFKSVIIASGASARWLGVEGEKELQDMVFLLVQLAMDSLKKRK